MAQSKALSKGTPQNKSIDSDNKSSGSTTSDRSVRLTSTNSFRTTNNDAADDTSKFKFIGSFNLSFHIILSS